MAFPTILARSVVPGTTSLNTKQTIPIPSAPLGSFVVVAVSSGYSVNITTLSPGWEVYTASYDTPTLVLFIKRSSTSDNTLVIQWPSYTRVMSAVVLVTDATDITTATAALGSGVTLNPSPHDAGLDQEYLWLAVGAINRSAQNPPGALLSYNGPTYARGASNSSLDYAATFAFERVLSARVEDPGSFTSSSSNTSSKWATYTFALWKESAVNPDPPPTTRPRRGPFHWH